MAMLLVFACKGGPVKEPAQVAGKDSAVLVSEELLNADSMGSPSEKYRGPFIKHRTFRIRNLVFSTQTFSEWSDEYEVFYESHFLIVRDPARKVADTINMKNEDGDMSDNIVEDMTDSLKFRTVVVKITSWGSSDYQSDDFFEYAGDSLRFLFSLSYLRDIRRKDEHTLVAIERGRDDVLAEGYDYPVIINLRDNSTTGDLPDTQAIRSSTTTLEPFTVYKVRSEQLSAPYEVKTGTKVIIDTFFRKTGLIRMLLPDSTPVFIMEQDLRQKIETNTAG